jgi:hypothetical protein
MPRPVVVSSKCRVCGSEFTAVKPLRRSWGVEFQRHNGRTMCSNECRRLFYRTDAERKTKIGAATRGTRHWNWQGGKTRQSDSGYRGSDWSIISAKIRARDGNRCRDCGRTNEDSVAMGWGALDVHHKIPFHNFTNSRQANRPDNLLTLCRPCHRRADAAVSAIQQILPFATNGSGRRPGYAKGERASNVKLTEEQVRRLRDERLAGAGIRALGRRYGVSPSHITSIVKGRSWRCVPLLQPPVSGI